EHPRALSAQPATDIFLEIYPKIQYAYKVILVPSGSCQGWPRGACIHRGILLVEDNCVIIIVKRRLRASDRAFPGEAMNSHDKTVTQRSNDRASSGCSAGCQKVDAVFFPCEDVSLET